MGLSWLGAHTLTNHERMELSWANNVYNTEFSVETRLELGVPENTRVFPMKIAFCILLSLLQFITRFKVAYSARSQTNAVFMGKL